MFKKDYRRKPSCAVVSQKLFEGLKESGLIKVSKSIREVSRDNLLLLDNDSMPIFIMGTMPEKLKEHL